MSTVDPLNWDYNLMLGEARQSTFQRTATLTHLQQVKIVQITALTGESQTEALDRALEETLRAAQNLAKKNAAYLHASGRRSTAEGGDLHNG